MNLERRLPVSLRALSICGLQHVLVMYASAVMTPLILGAALGLSPADLTYLISADLFTCGIATLLQAKGVGNFIGIKLPVILGCTPIALLPMISAGKIYGIPTIYGSVIVSGLFVFLIAPLFQKVSRLFPPIVVGTVISIIGLTLIIVGANNIANGHEVASVLRHNLILATVVITSIFLIYKFCKGFFQSIAVLLSLVIGTIVASYFGMVDFAAIKTAHWFSFITPFYFGVPQFKIGPIVSMCFISLIIMIESTAVFYTLGEVCDQKIDSKQIVKGLRTEGISQILGGVLNSFPYNTFAQNVGLLVLSGIKSRYVAIVAGIILLILGLIPKFAALMTVIPKPALGGAVVILYGTITAYGMRLCAKADLKNPSNIFVIAGSVGVALTVTLKPELLRDSPDWFKIIFGNGVVTGSLLAIVLNSLFNDTKQQENEINERL